MELEGKIIQINPPVTGEGKNGAWKKQEFVIETKSQYPKKVCITAWGDKIDMGVLKPNVDVKVSIEIESREYNNRWYTDVKAWKIEKAGAHMGQDGFVASEPEILPPSNDPPFEDAPF